MENCNHFILSLGSNEDAEIHIASACHHLETLFPAIYFSEAVYTPPINCPASKPFLNCVACATTVCSLKEVYAILKNMEENAGRTPESKAQGIVPLDIDVLKWNNDILKPADMERDYIREALHTLCLEN